MPVEDYNQGGSGIATNWVDQLPEYARRHPRFEEARRALELILRYRRDDPRAVPYQMVLREVTEEMEEEGLNDMAVRESLRWFLGR